MRKQHQVDHYVSCVHALPQQCKPSMRRLCACSQVPQLEDLSQILHAKTGWRIRPVAGLLHPRDFLVRTCVLVQSLCVGLCVNDNRY